MSSRSTETLSLKSDFMVATVVFLIAAAMSLFLASHIPEVLSSRINFNVWFGADVPRVFGNMHTVYHLRDLLVHPLFPLFIRPLATGFTSIGLTPNDASTFIVAVSAGVMTALLFLIARGLRLTVMSSGLICIVFLVSGAFSFWWSVIETFPIGGATIAFLLLVFVKGVRAQGIWVMASVLTFSMTITNGFVSVIGAYLKFGIWKAQKIILASLLLLILLLVVQQTQYPVSLKRTVAASVQDETLDKPSTFFSSVLGRFRQYGDIAVGTYLKEMRFVYSPHVTEEGMWESTRVVFTWYTERAMSFLVYPGVVPRPVLITEDRSPVPLIRADDWAYGPSGILAVGCWIVLLVGGLHEAMSRATRCLFSTFLLYWLVFQFTLHLLYGDTPFLYSAHFMLPLVLLAACGFRGDNRVVLQIAGIVFCVSAAINNLHNFFIASTYLSQYVSCGG